jgi:YihY family inner membrane protein
LLLVLATILKIVLRHDAGLRHQIIDGATTYFPVVGSELQHNIHSLGKTGLALIVGVLLTLYGARGVGNAFRYSVNHIWQVPRSKRSGFPLGLLKSFALIFVGGIGLLAASVTAGYSANAGSLALSLLLAVASLLILFSLFPFMIKISLPVQVTYRQVWLGAVAAAVGLAILQEVGGYLLTHELKNLDNLYGTFALVLGLLFWIYLQAQIVLYALEIETVRLFKLWPRSLVEDNLTDADKRALTLYARRNRLSQKERVDTVFEKE